MKRYLALFLFARVAVAADATPPEWAGKLVAIKTTNAGTSCIRIQKFVVSIGKPEKAAPNASVFKVVPGSPPGTFAFESVESPGMFLHHSHYRIVLLRGTGDSTFFRIAPPLRGSQGVSLQSYDYPTHHISVMDMDRLGIVENIKEPRKAIFYFEERKK